MLTNWKILYMKMRFMQVWY